MKHVPNEKTLTKSATSNYILFNCFLTLLSGIDLNGDYLRNTNSLSFSLQTAHFMVGPSEIYLLGLYPCLHCFYWVAISALVFHWRIRQYLNSRLNLLLRSCWGQHSLLYYLVFNILSTIREAHFRTKCFSYESGIFHVFKNEKAR